MAGVTMQVAETEWVALPGGELEGRRPKTLCGPCRMRKAIGAPSKATCFECFKADRKREAAFAAAGEFEAASAERFQDGLPFEPVNVARLEQLRFEREDARERSRKGTGRYGDRRRQAQIAARHALERAVELGATEYTGADKTIDAPAVFGIGGSLLYFVDRYGPKGSP